MTTSTVRVRAHLRAMSSTMEIIIIASVIALVADFTWVLHDIKENGFSVSYMMIGSALFLATAMTAYALRKHHNDTVQNGIRVLLTTKIAEQKARNRINRKLTSLK